MFKVESYKIIISDHTNVLNNSILDNDYEQMNFNLNKESRQLKKVALLCFL